MNTPAAQLTDEQLRAAWRLCKLKTWPATFEEAMADPTRSRLVRLHACVARRGPAAMTTASSRRRPRPAPTQAPGYVDCKRAAAGDRDD